MSSVATAMLVDMVGEAGGLELAVLVVIVKHNGHTTLLKHCL